MTIHTDFHDLQEFVKLFNCGFEKASVWYMEEDYPGYVVIFPDVVTQKYCKTMRGAIATIRAIAKGYDYQPAVLEPEHYEGFKQLELI